MGVEEVAPGPDGDGHEECVGAQPRSPAKVAAMGAITSTVAALLRKGVTAIAASMMSASAATGSRPAEMLERPLAMRSVAPVARRLSDTGMSAASMIRIGPSICV